MLNVYILNGLLEACCIIQVARNEKFDEMLVHSQRYQSIQCCILSESVGSRVHLTTATARKKWFRRVESSASWEPKMHGIIWQLLSFNAADRFMRLLEDNLKLSRERLPVVTEEMAFSVWQISFKTLIWFDLSCPHASIARLNGEGA